MFVIRENEMLSSFRDGDHGTKRPYDVGSALHEETSGGIRYEGIQKYH